MPFLQPLSEVQRELPVLLEVNEELGQPATVRLPIEPTNEFCPKLLRKHDRVQELAGCRSGRFATPSRMTRSRSVSER